jgi:hypothetical protein
LADKSFQVMVDGLVRAAAEPAGLPLFGFRNMPGLFAASAPARLAAKRCQDEGYLQVVANEVRGKKEHEICAITEKGLTYLFSHVSPRTILEELVEVLRTKSNQLSQLVATARQWQSGLEKLQEPIAKALEQVKTPVFQAGPYPVSNNGSTHSADAWLSEATAILGQRDSSGISGDCPLPQLYRHVIATAPKLSIGQFHDGLRKLYEQQRIYLHPWTGPLYDIPEPPYALMIGHEIAYYASARQGS